MKYLARNLYALSIHSPEAAVAVAAATPIETSVVACPSPQLDFSAFGCVVIVGWNGGAMVRDIATRGRRCTPVVCIAPDVGELRWSMEHEDWGDWFNANPQVTIVADPTDAGAMTRAVRKAGLLAIIGVEFVENPPGRWPESLVRDTCADSFQALLVDCNTEVYLSDTMLKNALNNVCVYVKSDGIGPLFRSRQGQKGVVVSAGPSMRKALPKLRRAMKSGSGPVVVAVQTALKPLLAAKIRPHYVCVLDYHAISQRFYEGITAADVEGCELIANVNCDPGVLRMWPGLVRCLPDDFLDELLGEELYLHRHALPRAATVSHMAYHLARFLGCDPVGLIGQDLAFTDGVYYGAGAAIHETWACEVNQFNSLESMESQRILRNRHALVRRHDHDGRRVYTDIQMEHYRIQFERMFFDDAGRGLRTVDLGGGVPKAHTDRMTFEEFAAC